MNENEIMEGQGLTEQDFDAFDEEWADMPVDDEADEPAETAEPAEENDAPTAEEPVNAEPEEAEAEEPEPEVQDAGEEGHQLFKLKHLGEEREVDLTELTALAQKGLDYDGVRQERDELRGKAKTPDDYAELQAKAGYLQEIADLAGSSIDELILRTRANKLMREDKSLSETDAILKAKLSVETKAEEKQPEAEKPAGGEPPEDNSANLRIFVETYPDVKPESIPQEVWMDSFKHGGDLTGAYTRWENKQMKAQITQLKQSQQNKARSTGSRKTAGAAVSKDAFDEGWDS